MRQLAIQMLAISLPLGSFVALKLKFMPPLWLGIPDAVLTAGVLIGLLSRGSALFRLSIGLLVSSSALVAFSIWPIQSVLVFPILLNLLLAEYFHHSLVPAKEPIITRIARLERGKLPEEIARYTRQLTWAWCIFFLVIAVQLVVLAVFATMETYLLFANTLNYIFVAVFFLSEYVYRQIRFPHYTQKPILHLVTTLINGRWLATDRVKKEMLKQDED
jgi:uncharacterized membrane protein